MALEPRTITLEEEDNPELRDMSRRFWFAVALTVPLLALAMGDMLPGQPISQLMNGRTRVLLELGLATPVCLWSAWPFFVRAVASVTNRSLNMFTLIGLGVSVAYGYSVVAALVPSLFPPGFRDHHGEVGVYFEAASAIVTLILLGSLMLSRLPEPPRIQRPHENPLQSLGVALSLGAACNAIFGIEDPVRDSASGGSTGRGGSDGSGASSADAGASSAGEGGARAAEAATRHTAGEDA